MTSEAVYRLKRPIRTTRIYHANSVIYFIREVDNLGRRMYLFRLEDAATTWLFEGEFYEDTMEHEQSEIKCNDCGWVGKDSELIRSERPEGRFVSCPKCGSDNLE